MIPATTTKVISGGGTFVSNPAAVATVPRTSTSRVSVPQVRYARPSHVWSAKEAARNVRAFAANGGASSSPRSVETFPMDFDLDLAVALSDCAFHAYEKPTQGDLFTTCNDKNTTVTYMNRRIPPTDCLGVLEIHLKGASGLRDADSLMGKSDPYAILSVGKSNIRSKRVNGTSNPNWNQTFRFLVRDMNEDILRVQVWDYDSLGADDDLGFAQIQVKDLNQGSMQDIELKLGGQGEGGIVKLAAMYKPLEEVFNGSNEDQPPVKANSGKASDRKVTQTSESFVPPVFFIDNMDTGTQVWVHCTDFNSDQKKVVIAFRGADEAEDQKTDAWMLPTNLDKDLFNALEQAAVIRPDEFDWFGLFPPPGPAGRNIKVHQGFSTAYDSVKETVKDVVNWITDDRSGWKVYVTGHSLGGALGTLCALELSTRENMRGRVQMYNYGSPRVGTADFAAACNAAIPTAWRVKTKGDPVTLVPFLQGLYTHAGKSMTMDKDYTVKFSDPEKPENFWFKMVGGVGSYVMDKNLIGNPIFKEEVAILLKIVTAPAHGEDEYVKRLNEVAKRQMD